MVKIIMRQISLFFLILLALTFHFSRASALETPWQSASNLQGRLISAVEAVGTRADIPAALEIRLAQGWHMYWRMAGAGGLPPVFDWSASENVADVVISWPIPRRYTFMDMESFGYEGTVLFPLTIKPKIIGEALTLNLKADIMVCNEICVPQTITLIASLPAGAETEGSSAAVIARAFEKLPAQKDGPALAIKSVILGPDALVAQVEANKGLQKIDLFVEAQGVSIWAPPEIIPDKDDPRKGLVRIAKPPGMDNLATALSGQSVTLTLTDGVRALEKTYPF